MAMDKLNSLQFLSFFLTRIEEFGGKDGVAVDRVPFELRDRLFRWKSIRPCHESYFFEDGRRLVVTRDGWEAFIRWVCRTLDARLASDEPMMPCIPFVSLQLDGPEIVATFEDGRIIRHDDAMTLAALLWTAGARAEDVQAIDWHDDPHLALSGGQKITIFNYLRRQKMAQDGETG